MAIHAFGFTLLLNGLINIQCEYNYVHYLPHPCPLLNHNKGNNYVDAGGSKSILVVLV